MTDQISQTDARPQTRLAGSLTSIVIACGLLAEALVGGALIMPGTGAAIARDMTASEPVFQLRFSALAALCSVEAYADQAMGAADHAANAALASGGQLLSAAGFEQLHIISVPSVQMRGDNVSVVLFGVKWVLAGT
jgi:hypothetical protein